MFQPRAKLNFISRYCRPGDGWAVFADIDPSELGRTGGETKSTAAQINRVAMQADGEEVLGLLRRLGVCVDKRREKWMKNLGGLPFPRGDHDVIAVHDQEKRILIVEIEGASSAQPETKVYRAVGQVIAAAEECAFDGLARSLGVAVVGEKVANHLNRCRQIEKLGVWGLWLGAGREDDRWLFHPAEAHWLIGRP